MTRKITIVFYAINGTGLGHISRLNNIAVDAKYLCSKLNITPNFEFITTSDSPSLVREFLVTKYPSKTTINELNLPLRKTTAKIKTQIINQVSSLNPDCLVLDTNPKGSYGEYLVLRDLVGSSVFIDRARKACTIDSATKKYIKLYDSVVVPETVGQLSSFPFHPNISHCGKIHGYKPEKSYSRDEVRNIFGANQGNLVYISSGGGGDPLSESILSDLIKQAIEADKTAKFVIGYGPLYQGDLCYSNPRVIPYTSNHVSRYFKGFDYAISAGGYNTFEELRAAKCPTLFYSLNKGMDNQEERIRKASTRGRCFYSSDSLTSSIINEFRLKIPNISQQLSTDGFEHGSAHAAFVLIKTILRKRTIDISEDELQNSLDELISHRENHFVHLSNSISA